jgi:hypothetical protein
MKSVALPPPLAIPLPEKMVLHFLVAELSELVWGMAINTMCIK